jgi:periplasmic copper chaperone A
MSFFHFSRLHRFALLCGGLIFSIAAHAQVYAVGDLLISAPWARATVPGQPAGAVYLSMENKGKSGNRLIAVSTPIAKSAQVHSMSMDGNIMRMREVGSLDIKPEEKIVMQAGNGYHIMLIGLNKPLGAGDRFPLTLSFEKGGKLEISVLVKAPDNGNAMAGMHH